MIFLLLRGGIQHNADTSLHLHTAIQATNLRVFLHNRKKLIRFSQFAENVFVTRAPSSSKTVVASLRGSISLVLIILHPLNPT